VSDKRISPNMTYLVGDDGGAVRTNIPKVVELFKRMGFKECSHREYGERLRWQRKEDAKVSREDL